MNIILSMPISWGCDDWALLPLLSNVAHSQTNSNRKDRESNEKIKLINTLQINPQSLIWINRTVLSAIRWFLTVGAWLALQRMRLIDRVCACRERVQRVWGEERIILNNGYIFELLRNVLLPCDCRALWDFATLCFPRVLSLDGYLISTQHILAYVLFALQMLSFHTSFTTCSNYKVVNDLMR